MFRSLRMLIVVVCGIFILLAAALWGAGQTPAQASPLMEWHQCDLHWINVSDALIAVRCHTGVGQIHHFAIAQDNPMAPHYLELILEAFRDTSGTYVLHFEFDQADTSGEGVWLPCA